MEHGPLAGQIVEAYDGMSAQLQAAARYVLDHPRDVALLSMREQARQAGVQPATMTRLAKNLGLDGYDAIREAYASALRAGDIGFAGKAGAQALTQKLKGDHALAGEVLASMSRQIAGLMEEAPLDRIVTAANRLASARRVYCLGLRSSHPAAWHFHYILSLIGEKSIILDGIGGTGSDMIGRATEQDVLFVVSVLPYTRATIEIAEYAHSRGIPVVAITDSEVAPLAKLSEAAVIIPTDSPSFFHTMAPAFAVAEVLATLVAGHGGDEALEGLRRFDDQLGAFKVHLTTRAIKRQP